MSTRVVATIQTARATRLIIGTSMWNGAYRVEFRPQTAPIRDVYMSAGPPVSFPVEQIDELAAAIAVVKEAYARGLIGK